MSLFSCSYAIRDDSVYLKGWLQGISIAFYLLIIRLDFQMKI